MRRIKGLERLERKLVKEIPLRAEKGVLRGLKHVYATSQRLVPVDTGALKRSGLIEPFSKGNKHGYLLRYRALNKETGYNYAPIQHENLSFNHRVGQAKYLQEAVVLNLDNIKREVIKELLR